jgi:hypothetical protein
MYATSMQNSLYSGIHKIYESVDMSIVNNAHFKLSVFHFV